MSLEKGTVVQSLAGREKGFFAVLDIADNHVLIANGHHYKVEKPKRKNVKHLSATATKLSDEQIAYNNRLKKALSVLADTRRNVTGG